MEERPSTLLAIAALLLVGVSGVYGTLFWLRHDPGPGEKNIYAASDFLRARHQPGDVIFLLPAYATRAREWLGDLMPVLAVDHPELEDLEIVNRVWIQSMFHAGDAAGLALEARGFKKTLDETPAPGVRVALYERPVRYGVSFDFAERLKSAKVWHEVGGRRTMCDQWFGVNGQGGAAPRWGCQQNRDWFYVSPEYHRMGEQTRRCLWAHPPNQGSLVVSYPDVPLDGVITVHGGHTIKGSVYGKAPVFVDVTVGSEPTQRFVYELEDTWIPNRLAVSTTTTATVTFAVSTPNDSMNHFCFTADVRQPRTSGSSKDSNGSNGVSP